MKRMLFLMLFVFMCLVPFVISQSSGDTANLDTALEDGEVTVDEFDSLPVEDRQEYLLRYYDMDLAAVYISESSFTDPKDRMIAQQFFSDDPNHVNDYSTEFSSYMEEEGIYIELLGPVQDFEINGNLIGNDQELNLYDLKNSPSAQEYIVLVTEEGNIELQSVSGSSTVAFTGDLEVHRQTGRFMMDDGTINGHHVVGGRFLVFDEYGDINGGSVEQYSGVTFAQPTTIATEADGHGLLVYDGEIVSVDEDTDLYLYGTVTFQDYDAVGGTLTVSQESKLLADGMIIFSKEQDIALRFGDDSSKELGEMFVRFTDDSVMLNGNDLRVAFNGAEFTAGEKELSVANMLVEAIRYPVTISTDGEELFIEGEHAVIQVDDTVYRLDGSDLYQVVKVDSTEDSSDVSFSREPVSEISSDGLGVSVNIVTEGKVMSTDGSMNYFFGDGPTVAGVAMEVADIAADFVTSDAEALQERINTIEDNIVSGSGVSADDQEFLVALMSGVANAGRVVTGPNSGAALHHYVHGEGEELVVDEGMFLDSQITQEAMKGMEQEIKRQVTLGNTEGSFSSVSCDCLVDVQREYGNIHDGGVVKAVTNADRDLYFTNHNFIPKATWEEQEDGTIAVSWEVDDPYDFKRNFGGTETVDLPIIGTDEEVVFQDGTLHAMANDIGVATEFNVHAEWETIIE
jgi:hypothetical protein